MVLIIDSQTKYGFFSLEKTFDVSDYWNRHQLLVDSNSRDKTSVSGDIVIGTSDKVISVVSHGVTEISGIESITISDSGIISESDSI